MRVGDALSLLGGAPHESVGSKIFDLNSAVNVEVLIGGPSAMVDQRLGEVQHRDLQQFAIVKVSQRHYKDLKIQHRIGLGNSEEDDGDSLLRKCRSNVIELSGIKRKINARSSHHPFPSQFHPPTHTPCHI